MLRKFIVALAAILASSIAVADTVPELVQDLGKNRKVFKLCDAQAATGVCTKNGDEVVLDARGYSSLTFYSTQSTATSVVCTVTHADIGYDALTAAGQTGETVSSNLTQTIEMLATGTGDTDAGAHGFVWVNCTTITGGNVTITVIATQNQ